MELSSGTRKYIPNCQWDRTSGHWEGFIYNKTPMESNMTWPEVPWVGLSQFMYHHMLHEEAGTCEEGIFNEKLSYPCYLPAACWNLQREHWACSGRVASQLGSMSLGYGHVIVRVFSHTPAGYLLQAKISQWTVFHVFCSFAIDSMLSSIRLFTLWGVVKTESGSPKDLGFLIKWASNYADVQLSNNITLRLSALWFFLGLGFYNVSLFGISILFHIILDSSCWSSLERLCITSREIEYEKAWIS